MRRIVRSRITGHRLVQSLVLACLMGMLAAGHVNAAPTTKEKTPSAAKAQKGSDTHSLPGRWHEAASMSTPRTGHTATRLLNGKVLVVGGEGGGVTAELFDPQANHGQGAWSAVSPLPYPRTGHSAVLLPTGNVLIFGGGFDLSNETSRSVLLFDPIINEGKGEWKALQPLIHPRINSTATLLQNGKILVVGGEEGVNPVGNIEIEVYDPEANHGQGESVVVLEYPRLRPGLKGVLLHDGRVLFVGNYDTSGAEDQPAYLYDPLANKGRGEWVLASSDVTGPAGQTLTLLPNGMVLIIGLGGSEKLKSGEMTTGSQEQLYDPMAGNTRSWNTWKRASRPRQGRYRHTATLLNDGTVLIAGGEQPIVWSIKTPVPKRLRTLYGGSDTSLATAELYKPDTLDKPDARDSRGSWMDAGQMATPRANHTATLLADGRVLVVGGEHKTLNNSHKYLASAEIYEPIAAK